MKNLNTHRHRYQILSPRVEDFQDLLNKIIIQSFDQFVVKCTAQIRSDSKCLASHRELRVSTSVRQVTAKTNMYTYTSTYTYTYTWVHRVCTDRWTSRHTTVAIIFPHKSSRVIAGIKLACYAVPSWFLENDVTWKHKTRGRSKLVTHDPRINVCNVDHGRSISLE